ncbi:ABC transporter ATP-binding protein [Ramlibacter sp. G-1-2-2]|uniref:ABC transporter ATP-binding protein n=1 Tax=Ramlibacter agri TaxID=2728837 RepID=A0A848H7C3_9BURK|nr:ABC transporter ATP-binding protein [Ramlibacter agri]NML43578.1 ABC transporter ATP-binding protein [Ramlibacter agri]
MSSEAAPVQGDTPVVAANDHFVVEVRGLRKHYAGRKIVVHALDGVDLVVRPGELVVLLGPSGCGKTTLLRCIAGLERPPAGEIRVAGRTVFSARDQVFVPPEQRRIGMMFQSYALWPHMTVAENIAYPLPSSVPRVQREARVAEMLERLGVAGLGHRYPGELSGGQQQRVALARALIASQSLVLFDEPLSNVDAKVRRKLRAELRELKRHNGFAGVYVTHDQEEAMELADTLVVMEAGRIVQAAPPREVYRRPANSYVAGFVGEINRWPARAGADGRVACSLGDVALSAPAGTQGHIGIRPEHVRVVPAGRAATTDALRVPAQLEDSVHLGARIEMRLRAGAQAVTASLPEGEGGELEPGAQVEMILPREKLLWLPA